VLQAFPNAFGEHNNGIVVGNPIRSSIEGVSQNREHDSDGEYKHILVLGGSQGAMALNEKVPLALKEIAKEFNLKILHQTGERGYDTVINAYQGIENAEAQAFINNMAQAYAWADLVICRSGALTVSEVAAAGLPSILIPFPFAIDDHQTANAKFLANAGAAILLPQAAMTKESLTKALFGLFRDQTKLPKMGDCAISVAKFGVAEKVADICMECMSEY
jgi:UDP-N-acetylglucosamine--N-acetylmuramyl-(pentapeptide) pyrophosphoryl-undecaprenol N-acetylglucosamine transferase